jgi:hypothetical protein
MKINEFIYLIVFLLTRIRDSQQLGLPDTLDSVFTRQLALRASVKLFVKWDARGCMTHTVSIGRISCWNIPTEEA